VARDTGGAGEHAMKPYEQEAISWIAEWRNEAPDQLNLDTCVNGGLPGLGVDGDDAVPSRHFANKILKEVGLPKAF